MSLNRKFTVNDIPVLKAELSDAYRRLDEIEHLEPHIRIYKAEEVAWLGQRVKNIRRIIDMLTAQLKPASIAA